MKIKPCVLPAACCVLLLMGACSEPRIGGNTPLDARFGDAVRAAQAAQTLNPAAAQNVTPPPGLDGHAAKASIDRYEKSFEVPPAPANVYTIGVGTGASGASGATAPR